ncbi:MAG: hypothetical protein ACYTG6_08220 [Planctomycetota bacterium]
MRHHHPSSGLSAQAAVGRVARAEAGLMGLVLTVLLLALFA